jgi:hypothetical protein
MYVPTSCHIPPHASSLVYKVSADTQVVFIWHKLLLIEYLRK